MDFPVSFKERLAMRIHLFICRNCARFARQMHLIHDWLHAHDEGEVGESLSEEARKRIQSRLDKPDHPVDSA
jgi:hypothetical protein